MRGKTVNVRLSWQDYQRLLELRLAMHLASDSATVRALIRLNHTERKSAIAALARRDPAFVERYEELQQAARQLLIEEK